MKAPQNSTAVGMVHNMALDLLISPGQRADFGIKTHDHYRVMQRAIKAGDVTADMLFDSIFGDCNIDKLVRMHNQEGLHFHSIYLGM